MLKNEHDLTELKNAIDPTLLNGIYELVWNGFLNELHKIILCIGEITSVKEEPLF